MGYLVLCFVVVVFVAVVGDVVTSKPCLCHSKAAQVVHLICEGLLWCLCIALGVLAIIAAFRL